MEEIMNSNEFIQDIIGSKEYKQFLSAYIEAIYFTDTGDIGQPESYEDLTHNFLIESSQECRKFYNVYKDLFLDNFTRAGHDFWFTRNGHGVGFCDRSEIYGKIQAEELTRAAKFAGEIYSNFE